MNKFGLPTDSYGRIQTRNNMGFMFLKDSPLRAAFLNHIQPGDNVADLGCAYGQDSLMALEKGARVLAVDLDSDHLACLHGAVSFDQMDRLSVHCAHYPNDFLLSGDSFSAILFSRLFIFLTHAQLAAALRNAYEALHFGGQIFVMNATPFSDRWTKVRALYEKHAVTHPDTPFLISDLWSLLPPLSKYLPNQVMLFDQQSLTAKLSEAGFEVEQCNYWSHDGTVDVWAVGVKKG